MYDFYKYNEYLNLVKGKIYNNNINIIIVIIFSG